MINLLSIIGTFASILSLPLAVYFYLKTKDDKYNKVKSEIVSIILNHMGAGNDVSTSNVNSIIHTKLIEANLKSNKISRHEIIDAVETEIISNPLLSKELKKELLKSADQLYYFQHHFDDYRWEESVTIDINDDDDNSTDDNIQSNNNSTPDTQNSDAHAHKPGKFKDHKVYMRKSKRESNFNSESMKNAMSIIVLLTAIATSLIYPFIDTGHMKPEPPTLYYGMIAAFMVISLVLAILIHYNKK